MRKDFMRYHVFVIRDDLKALNFEQYVLFVVLVIGLFFLNVKFKKFVEFVRYYKRLLMEKYPLKYPFEGVSKH